MLGVSGLGGLEESIFKTRGGWRLAGLVALAQADFEVHDKEAAAA